MKIPLLTKLVLAFVTLTTVASFSGAWSAPQEPQKPAKKADTPQQGRGQGGRGGAQKIAQKPGGRSAKEAAIKKVLPTLTTPLSEAIVLAEKQSGGKAFSAGLEMIEGKASFQVNLFVGEEMTIAKVDPATKKVVIQEKPGKKAGAGGGAGEDDGEDEE